MNRKTFLSTLLAAGAAISSKADVANGSQEISFESLLENYVPNKNLFRMKDGKYKDFLLERCGPPKYQTLRCYNGAHGYKIPARFKNEEDLYDHLKLMAHELRKHTDRGMSHGEQIRFCRAWHQMDEFQLQWY